jgi:hypothetical protein
MNRTTRALLTPKLPPAKAKQELPRYSHVKLSKSGRPSTASILRRQR